MCENVHMTEHPDPAPGKKNLTSLLAGWPLLEAWLMIGHTLAIAVERKCCCPLVGKLE